jgi:hypothetical protein
VMDASEGRKKIEMVGTCTWSGFSLSVAAA